MRMLSILALLFCLSVSSNAQNAPEKELINCSVKSIVDVNNDPVQEVEYPSLSIKLTKTNDKLYTLYIHDKSDIRPTWRKVMTLDEPVLWTKEQGIEVFDFYSFASYGYYLRLVTDSNYESLGVGFFLYPQTKSEFEKYFEPYPFNLENCRGKME